MDPPNHLQAARGRCAAGHDGPPRSPLPGDGARRGGEAGSTDPLDGGEARLLSWAAAAEDLRWYLEDYWKWPYGGFAARARGVEAMLGRLGRHLYRQVFAAEVNVVGAWRMQAGPKAQGLSPR